MKHENEWLLRSLSKLGLILYIVLVSCKPNDPDGKDRVNGEIIWEKSFGGNGSSVPTTMMATSDGGYLLGGNSSAGVAGDKSEPNFGSDDYWIVKVDKQGRKQWDRTFGGGTC